MASGLGLFGGKGAERIELRPGALVGEPCQPDRVSTLCLR